jgi:hypothetical protein
MTRGARPRRRKARAKRIQYPGRSPGREPIRGIRAAKAGSRKGGEKAVKRKQEIEASEIYAAGRNQGRRS